MAELELLEGGTAESRATTILMSVFGYTVVMELIGLDVWDKMLKMMTDELGVVAAHGFTTMPAAPDCRKMSGEEIAKAIPGIVTWEQLKEILEVHDLKKQVARWQEIACNLLEKACIAKD